jgi:hypothetical protein
MKPQIRIKVRFHLFLLPPNANHYRAAASEIGHKQFPLSGNLREEVVDEKGSRDFIVDGNFLFAGDGAG